MREYLEQLGINKKDIETLCELNPYLDGYDVKGAQKNVELLKEAKCSDLYIKNIIINNTYFLSNKVEQTKELMDYLEKELEFKDLDLLFDSNAYLLTLEKKYLEEFVSKKKKEKVSLEQIRDLIELNLFIMDNEESLWKK